jgi:cellobiose phosphorylase
VLRADQEEDFNLPAVSPQTATVYEHCLRALKYGYRLARTACRSWGPAIGTTA